MFRAAVGIIKTKAVDRFSDNFLDKVNFWQICIEIQFQIRTSKEEDLQNYIGARNCSFKTSLLQTVSSGSGFAKFQTTLRIIFAKLDLWLVVIHQVMA